MAGKKNHQTTTLKSCKGGNLSSCADYQSADMQILLHHVYEYKKGLRNLVLHTMSDENRNMVEDILNRKQIHYFLQILNTGKINVFFGNEKCVRIIKSFGNKSLSDFTDEEDFMLGTMLGYDRMQQCERFIKRKKLDEIHESELPREFYLRIAQ